MINVEAIKKQIYDKARAAAMEQAHWMKNIMMDECQRVITECGFNSLDRTSVIKQQLQQFVNSFEIADLSEGQNIEFKIRSVGFKMDDLLDSDKSLMELIMKNSKLRYSYLRKG